MVPRLARIASISTDTRAGTLSIGKMKASVGYGDVALERSGLEGDTKTLLTRLQSVY